jgi:hypothetical protein
MLLDVCVSNRAVRIELPIEANADQKKYDDNGNQPSPVVPSAGHFNWR